MTSATFNLKLRTSNILWRIVDLIVGGIFIYAGALKMFDPVRFASDIDNYKILPWTIGVALAFYVPWLEIFCGIALVLRFLYRGGLSILTALVLVFTLATVAAKVRGLDITCGCFGQWASHHEMVTRFLERPVAEASNASDPCARANGDVAKRAHLRSALAMER
ncbi:MAG: DoxX family protein [Verrucomicrobia bacterium]|nr:MAG: DoxX family protein [Verrucomicrobiota bacterium]